MTTRYLEKCNCSFRIRMVGDGCQYCNPEYYERYKDPEPLQLFEEENDPKLERPEQ